MANTDPMFIEHPGAGKLRSMTLDEWVGQLIPEHPARAELAAIRAKALDGAKAMAQVLDLLEQNKRLAAELESVRALTPRNETQMSNLGTELLVKVACPYCQRMTSVRPGAWKSHMLNKHADQVYVDPPKA